MRRLRKMKDLRLKVDEITEVIGFVKDSVNKIHALHNYLSNSFFDEFKNVKVTDLENVALLLYGITVCTPFFYMIDDYACKAIDDLQELMEKVNSLLEVKKE
jgi:hypothetical protein